MRIRTRVQIGSRYSPPSSSSGDGDSLLLAFLFVMAMVGIVFGCIGLALVGGGS